MTHPDPHPASWACLRRLAPSAATLPDDGLPAAALAAALKASGRAVQAVQADSLEDLAQATEGGGAAVLFVNAGLLWGDPQAVDGGEANHCVVVRGMTGDDSGWASGTVDDPVRGTEGEVPAGVLVDAWLRVGGRMLAVG